MHPDTHDPYHSLPWLGRLSVNVAGYAESLKRGDRRSADRTLRLAVIQRLQAIRSRLEETIRQCRQREATSHATSLERVESHLDRVLQRVHASDTRIEASYDERKVDSAQADFLHATHLAIFEQAETLVKHFDEPDIHHDRLPHLEADLHELERLLDEKARSYQKLD